MHLSLSKMKVTALKCYFSLTSRDVVTISKEIYKTHIEKGIIFCGQEKAMK
jgi:hypothetical protein